MSSLLDTLSDNIDWSLFWQKFKTYSDWNLEWFDGSVWISIKADLTVELAYPEPNRCKIILKFKASKAGNYRLTFGIDKVAMQYIDKSGQYQVEVTYEDMIITFDWSDCVGISGLQFSKGVTQDKFWFRISRNNVPLGAQLTIDPSTIGTSTATAATQYVYQRKTFYTNGRFWAFYSNGTNIVYRTSADGSTWTSETIIGSGDVGLYFATVFDGTYLHYARGSWGTTMYYRRGTPNSDGTITWSAAEQTVVTQSEAGFIPSIAVDSGGYAWIGYRKYDGTSYYPSVTKNAKNDGTWTTASGFPYQLSATANSAWRVLVVPLTSLKMYILYAVGYDTIKGRLYDGGMGSGEVATTSNVISGQGLCAVNQGDDVHLVFTKSVSPYPILHVVRTYGVGWGSEVTVQSSVTTSSFPVLSINLGNSDLYCFWAGSPTANHIYYKKRTASDWDASPTDWIDESTDVLTGNDRLTTFYRDYGSYIGLIYMTKTASPYNVKFAFLTLAVVKEVTDSLSLSDAILTDKTFSISESVGSVDSVLRDWSPQVTDASSLSEIISLDKSFSIIDTITSLDLILIDKTLAILDSLNLIEQILVGKEFTISESIGLSDQISIARLLEILDSIGALDQVLTDKNLISLDSIGLSDSILLDKLVILADQLISLDQIFLNKTFVISDQIGLLDMVELVLEVIHALAVSLLGELGIVTLKGEKGEIILEGEKGEVTLNG